MLVNLTDHVVAITQNGVLTLVPKAKVRLVLNCLHKVDQDQTPIWESCNDFLLVWKDRNPTHAFDGTYQWNATDTYIVDPEVGLALTNVQSDCKFAVPIEKDENGNCKGLLRVNTK